MKKKTRTITVNDEKYEWLVRTDIECLYIKIWNRFKKVVHDEEYKGDGDITPKTIREIILSKPRPVTMFWELSQEEQNRSGMFDFSPIKQY